MPVTRKAATVILIACVMAQPSLSALEADQVVVLRAGTPVFLIFEHSIDSEAAKEGDTIYLLVLRPVVVEDAVIIRSGETVRAKVSEVKKASGWGSRGDLTVRVESTTAVDGQEVLLSAVQRREGEGRGGTATAVGVGLGLLCLPLAFVGFAVKGEEGRVPMGYEIKAYTDEDKKITLATVNQPSPADEMQRGRELQERIEKEVQREKEEQAKKEKEQQQSQERPRI